MRITDLEPGAVYVVTDSFRDDGGTLVLPGDRLTFERYVVVPQTGELDVIFREETLTLSEDRQRDVVEHVEWFLSEA